MAGVVLLLLVAAGIYAPLALTRPLPLTVAAVDDLPELAQEAASPVFPDFGRGAIGAVGFEGVLATSGDQDAFPIASIAKVITALVVLEDKPIGADEQGPDIAFTDADVQIYNEVLAENGSLAPVTAGLVLSERQVLETMLIPSANNYAKSLALWAFGSEQSYLDAAEAWLGDQRLDDTTIVDTSGLSAENRSTPGDLVRLGKLALADPVVAQIVAMDSAVEPYIGTIENTNELLGLDGVDGIKTGTTDEAGACLLFSTDIEVGSETVSVVGAILGAPDHDVLDDAVLDLLDSAEQGFREVSLIAEGRVVGSFSTEWGERADVVTARGAEAIVWSDEPIESELKVGRLAEGSRGDDVGSATFDVGGETISVPLALADNVEGPDAWWRLTHPDVIFQ